MRVARITTTLTAVLLILFTYACSQGQQSTEPKSTEAASSNDPAVADAAAMINGKSIPMSELQIAVRNVVMQNGMDAGQLDQFMGQFGPRILDQLIDGELLFQAAERGGYIAAKEDLDTAFAELSGRYDVPEEFQTEMETRGFTESTLKANISKQISIQKYIEENIVPQAVISEDVVREAYDQNPQNFAREEEVKASHILINSAEGDPQEKKDEALKKALEIAAKAKADGADFAELARTNSEGPSAPSGGDLGFFTRNRMVKPFEEAAFSMKVNEVSDPVLTQFGYHIIKVTDRKKGSTVSFEEAKEKLGKDLKNRMINELIGQNLSQLREKADIEVLFNPAPPPAPGGALQGQPQK
jgi:peptidyl-prolyl cis-trans isomerase C